MKAKEQKLADKIQLDFTLEMCGFWKGRLSYIEKAVKNGRCNECNKPLMFDEKETCEDCLCPE